MLALVALVWITLTNNNRVVAAIILKEERKKKMMMVDGDDNFLEAPYPRSICHNNAYIFDIVDRT